MRALLIPLVLALLLTACGGDALEEAGCDCTTGKDGTTTWCTVHSRGWIQGKPVDGTPAEGKAAVDAALAAEVRANATARGQDGAWIDTVVSNVLSGNVEQKKCRCESCAKGETEHTVEDHSDEASKEVSDTKKEKP